MGRPAPGQLERSLAAMTIGAHQGLAKRRKALLDTHTGEYFQPVHQPMSGTAFAEWQSVDEAVQWEAPFLYAPLQRRVPFTTPHLHGAEFELVDGTALPFVDFRAQVVDWSVSDEGWYTGATVRLSAMAPTGGTIGGADGVVYEAVSHLTFGGYATMSETGEFGT